MSDEVEALAFALAVEYTKPTVFDWQEDFAGWRRETWRNVARVALQQQAEERAKLKALIESFVDPDPCWFDHHGGCQAHGYLELEEGQECPHAEAKRWLKEIE